MSQSPHADRGSRTWKWLLPAISVLLTVLALETAARLVSFALFGRAVQGQVRLRYYPFLEALDLNDKPPPGGKSHLQSERKLSELTKFARAANGGRLRVLVVGASVARGLPDELLAARLGELYPQGVEVINLAVPAHIVNQEVVMLGLFGLNLQPDLVISIDGANDVVAASKTGKPGLPIPSTLLAAAADSPVQYAVAAVARRSQLITLLLKWRERAGEREFASRPDLVATTQQQYLQAVRSLSIMARGAGAVHVMVLQPYLHLKKGLTAQELDFPHAKRYRFRSRFMADYMTALSGRMRNLPLAPGVLFVDGTTAFDGNAETCFVDEVHLTDHGYDLLVSRIVARLRASGLPAAAGGDRWPLAPAPGLPAPQVDFPD